MSLAERGAGVGTEPVAVVERLVSALNAHDLERMVSCFAEDYINETPVHPPRGFRGNEQVRTNWSQIFASVPDLTANVIGSAVAGEMVWTEWDIAGTRTDGANFLMRGVVIFGVSDEQIGSARFYLEPVEDVSGDVNAHTRRVTGRETT
jgi:ketosteroid isomerase-like protein